jgi:hypothetical protein
MRRRGRVCPHPGYTALSGSVQNSPPKDRSNFVTPSLRQMTFKYTHRRKVWLSTPGKGERRALDFEDENACLVSGRGGKRALNLETEEGRSCSGNEGRRVLNLEEEECVPYTWKRRKASLYLEE